MQLIWNAEFVAIFVGASQAVTAVLAALIGLYIVRLTSKSEFDNTLFSMGYLPIFRIIEPYLYKEISIEKVHELCELILKQIDNDPALFALYNIRDTIRILQSANRFNRESYFELCAHIDKGFDKTSRKVGIEVRDIPYRLNRQQYPSQSRLCAMRVWFVFRAALCAFAVVLLIFIAAVWLYAILRGLILYTP